MSLISQGLSLIHIYAKFVPVLGSMTIERQNGTSDEGNGDRVFVYRITAADDPAFELYVSIKGNGSEVTGIAAVGSEKSDIRVENTGNVKEFIRLRLVSYYVEMCIRDRFEDDGTPYDPTTAKEPDVTLSAEERDVGGLGIFICLLYTSYPCRQRR